jgi:PIN domain nuclease of toxin-antitoxin system
VRILLDTHALIWAVEDNPKLGVVARQRLIDRDNDILFSIVSIWEILIKVRKQRLHLDWRKVIAVAQEAGFQRVGVEPAHMQFLHTLPLSHGDPYDHLLIAQALAEDAAFMSLDRNVPHYPVEVVWG